MAFPRKISSLCAPALFYFVVAIISLIWGIWTNLNNNKKIVLGKYSMNVINTTLVFVIKLTFILLWTWILNLICRDGYPVISWILVFLPFIIIFLYLAAAML